MKSPTIVFFGTGPVSLATLEGIADSFTIEAIITKPAKSAAASNILAWAQTHSTKAYQLADKAGLSSLFKQTGFKSRVGLIVDYGLIVPQSVIDSFELGIVNSHFSLLPKLRGADPISFAILNGETETGVSLMKIVAALDAGPLIAQEKLPIEPAITGPQLQRRLIELSNAMVKRYLPLYLETKLKPKPQDPRVKPTYTRKLVKADGQIDWHKPAIKIEREVRAFWGWPASYAKLAGKDVIISEAKVVDQAGLAGQMFAYDNGFGVYCSDQALVIKRIKPAGKNEMSGAEFRRGYLAGRF